MSTKKKLVNELQDGAKGARKAKVLENVLNMPVGNTCEPTRQLIESCIENDHLPIGSGSKGYFLIDSQQELDKVVASLEGRIRGIQNRIDGIKSGWSKRDNSRKTGGNWPK